MPYDPATELTPVAGVGESALVLMVPADHPAQNLDEFLAYAAERPGKLNAGYGSASSQVSIALLNNLAGLDVFAVPYKGINQAVVDTIGGIVDFTFVDMGNAMTHAEGGRLRALGVTSNNVKQLRPDWPALSDRFPEFDIRAWLAVFGPANLPAETVAQLEGQIAEILAQPEAAERLGALGLQPMQMDSAALGAFVVSEIEKWKQLAQDANIEPQ